MKYNSTLNSNPMFSSDASKSTQDNINSYLQQKSYREEDSQTKFQTSKGQDLLSGKNFSSRERMILQRHFEGNVPVSLNSNFNTLQKIPEINFQHHHSQQSNLMKKDDLTSTSQMQIQKEQQKKNNIETNQQSDPLLAYFQDDKKETKDKAEELDKSESLSPLENDSPDEENNTEDFIVAIHKKVHRVKNKWKIQFINAILRVNKEEVILGKVTGDLNRDW